MTRKCGGRQWGGGDNGKEGGKLGGGDNGEGDNEEVDGKMQDLRGDIRFWHNCSVKYHCLLLELSFFNTSGAWHSRTSHGEADSHGG